MNKLFLIVLLSIYSIASMDQKITTITNVSSSEAIIDIGNLKYGQSGIVVHNYDDESSIIVSNAIVISSNNNESKVRFTKFNDLTQDALPTTNLKPSNGDTFILNYLYKKSLLIAPNGFSYDSIKEKFAAQSFFNSDVFASFLKLKYKPTPLQVDFQEFCKNNNLGTIYFVIDKKVYIVDSKSFVILEEHNIVNDDATQEQPFYTKVDEIKNGAFAWFENTNIGNYNNYYSNLINVGLSVGYREELNVEEAEESIFEKYLEKIGF